MLTIQKQYVCGCFYEQRLSADGDTIEARTVVTDPATCAQTATDWTPTAMNTAVLMKHGITSRTLLERLRDKFGWTEIHGHETERSTSDEVAARRTAPELRA